MAVFCRAGGGRIVIITCRKRRPAEPDRTGNTKTAVVIVGYAGIGQARFGAKEDEITKKKNSVTLVKAISQHTVTDSRPFPLDSVGRARRAPARLRTVSDCGRTRRVLFSGGLHKPAIRNMFKF